MSSWQCVRCRTVYPPGVPGCPNCEGGVMARANAAGSTWHIGEGVEVPADVPEGVRLVGPGSDEMTDTEPVPAVPEPEVVPGPGPGPDSTPPESSLVSSVLVEDYNAQPIRALRDLVRDRGLPVAGSKAELVARLEEHDNAELVELP